jgi:hypothetical protein
VGITQFYSCIHGKKEKNILIRVEKIDIAGFKKKNSTKNANKIN